MTVTEMKIRTTEDILSGKPKKEEILLYVDPSDTSWQETSRGKIRTGSLTSSNNNQHVRIPIEYEPKVLGEPGVGLRIRNIQLSSDGLGMDPLKSNREIEDRTVWVQLEKGKQLLQDIRTPLPEVLRPEDV